MAEISFKYLIVGGGLAAGSAAEGIREHDKDSTIGVLCSERFLPYDRPDLSKKLWFGKKQVHEVFRPKEECFSYEGVDVRFGVKAVEMDLRDKTVSANDGHTYFYEKCLLATGGIPRRLDIPGWDLWDVCYYRYLDDYLRMRNASEGGASAVVVGGGFIGSELAAAFRINHVDTTMIFPEGYLVSRIFPESFGKTIQDYYVQKGVKILNNDIPTSFEKKNGKFLITTRNGHQVESDILLVGAGITPNMDVAKSAGLELSNGVVVNELLQTSNTDVFAAGDVAFFPYLALNQQMRVEHWDNAINQGRYAGRNMAGAGQPYDYMPYFWSDLFEYGYEAIGDINSSLETHPHWIEENSKGVIYYIRAGSVVGVMTVNIYGKMDAVREVLSAGGQVTPADLQPIFEEMRQAA
jgi:3-phenylpropionate/trans-cinnamate dioxygenase ferredoxin reductase component